MHCEETKQFSHRGNLRQSRQQFTGTPQPLLALFWESLSHLFLQPAQLWTSNPGVQQPGLIHLHILQVSAQFWTNTEVQLVSRGPILPSHVSWNELPKHDIAEHNSEFPIFSPGLLFADRYFKTPCNFPTVFKNSQFKKKYCNPCFNYNLSFDTITFAHSYLLNAIPGCAFSRKQIHRQQYHPFLAGGGTGCSGSSSRGMKEGCDS